MEKLLASLTQSSGNILRVLATEFEGHALVDLRRWYRAGGDGELRPTKRGISISREQFPAFVDTMKEALTALEGLTKDPFGEEPEQPEAPAVDLFGGESAAPGESDDEGSPLRGAVRARAGR